MRLAAAQEAKLRDTVARARLEAAKPPPRPLKPQPGLFTDRQIEVVRLIARGLSNIEVGAELGITARTAKCHADIIRKRLGVRRREVPGAYLQATGDDPFPRPGEL